MNILDEIRVLDFTRVLAGPYATRVLADFGAEVIKVQSEKTAKGAESNTEAYFNSWNRNKLSITLDMSFPEATEIALKLASLSDVVVENFSPRVMSNWGLSYEALKEVKTDIIMLRMSAMGQTGPWKDYVAFGPTVQSLGGLTHMTSYSKDQPTGLGFSYADVVAGLYGAITVLSALEHRDDTGEGQCIDLSAYEATCTTLGPTILDHIVNQLDTLPRANNAPYVSASVYGCFRCKGEDRWCAIAVLEESQWKAFCRVMGSPEWSKKEKFASMAQRKKNEDELNGLIEKWTIEKTAEEIEVLLQSEGVPAGVVQNAEDLAEDPQLLERKSFVELDHPTLRRTITDNYPFKFGDKQIRNWKSAPLLGRDNDYVFRELLGLTDGEYHSFRSKGIIS